MGLEVKARIVPPVEPSSLLTAFKEKFTSLGWQIISEQENGFSVATHEVRRPGEWDQDFIIGLIPNADQTVILTCYLFGFEEVDLTVVAVNEVIKRFGSLAWWEEA